MSSTPEHSTGEKFYYARQGADPVGAFRWLVRSLGSGPGLAVIVGALGAGLALGTLPNILQEIAHNRHWPVVPVLAAGAVVGVALLASARLWLNRRDGVGIVLFMPPVLGLDWSRERLAAMAGHARRRHQTCFTVDVDELHPSLRGTERRKFALRVIQARLNEDAPGGVVSSPVAFYVVCTLSDAFELGRELRFQVHERVGVHAEEGIPVIAHASVGQTSEQPGKTVFTAVRVDSRLRRAPKGRWAREAKELLEFEKREFDVPVEYAHRTALIVQLTPNVGMVEDSCEVAHTGLVSKNGRHRGYLLDDGDPWMDGDPCGIALVVTGSVGHMDDRQKLYEAVVALIAQKWLALLNRRTAETGRQVEGLLFCSAQASIAFALGAVLGRSTSIVPHRMDLAGRTRPAGGTVDASGRSEQR